MLNSGSFIVTFATEFFVFNCVGFKLSGSRGKLNSRGNNGEGSREERNAASGNILYREGKSEL